uniref:Gustatory receptor n=1 Tax=Anopheles culicifacies TaxID=139723 RepID=A0A182MP42_9DIPT
MELYASVLIVSYRQMTQGCPTHCVLVTPLVEGMQVLNIFHALFITNVRMVRLKNHTIGYKIARAQLQLLLPLFAILTLAFLNPWVTPSKQCTTCLNWFTIIGRLLSTLVVVVFLIFDNFWQRHKLQALLQKLPVSGMLALGKKWKFSVKHLQLSMLLLCNILTVMELLYNLYRNHSYLYIWGVFSSVLIEHYILLNALLCQLLAETLAKAYEALRHILLVQPFTIVINEMVILEQCKDQLSDVLGVKLLLVLLHLLFNVSFCTYDILQKVLSQVHFNYILRLMIIAVQETVMLYALCFYYSMLELKFWPAFLSSRYVKLLNLIDYKDRQKLDTILSLGSVLESFKQQFASIFGLMELFHLLNIFVTCSVETYIVLYVVDVDLTLLSVAMNLYTAVAYVLSFLISTYAYGLVNLKDHDTHSNGMEELKFFNVFNYCFVSPTYLHYDPQTGRYVVRSRNVYRNVTLLTVIVTSGLVSASVLMLEFLLDRIGSVMGAIAIILHAVRLLVMVPLILWTLFYNRKLVHECTFALTIVEEKHNRLNLTWNRRKMVQLLSVQISSVVAVLLSAIAVHSNVSWRIERLRKIHYVYNICAITFLEFITLMHLMLAQCWTLFISHHIEELVWLVKGNKPLEVLHNVLTLWDKLQYFKQSIASTFGVMNVLHTLDALVTCAVETFTIFYIFELGLGIEGAFLSIATLILYSGSFYAFTYAHDRVKTKQSPKGATARRKHVLRNTLLLTGTVTIVSYLGLLQTFNNFRQMMRTVTEIVLLLKYTINGAIIKSELVHCALPISLIDGKTY